jgi:hypothetical protein
MVCAIFVPFLLLLCVRDTNRSCPYCHLSANKERQNPIKGRKKMHGVRDFCPVFAFFVRVGHEPFMSHYCHLKVAVRSANKERQNPIKGKKKRTACAIFVPFLLLLCAGHEPFMSHYCHLNNIV